VRVRFSLVFSLVARKRDVEKRVRTLAVRLLRSLLSSTLGLLSDLSGLPRILGLFSLEDLDEVTFSQGSDVIVILDGYLVHGQSATANFEPLLHLHDQISVALRIRDEKLPKQRPPT
jgi:hypothetical protein